MKPPFFPILRRAKAIEWNRISNVSRSLPRTTFRGGDDERNRGNDKKRTATAIFEAFFDSRNCRYEHWRCP